MPLQVYLYNLFFLRGFFDSFFSRLNLIKILISLLVTISFTLYTKYILGNIFNFIFLIPFISGIAAILSYMIITSYKAKQINIIKLIFIFLLAILFSSIILITIYIIKFNIYKIDNLLPINELAVLLSTIFSNFLLDYDSIGINNNSAFPINKDKYSLFMVGPDDNKSNIGSSNIGKKHGRSASDINWDNTVRNKLHATSTDCVDREVLLSKIQKSEMVKTSKIISELESKMQTSMTKLRSLINQEENLNGSEYGLKQARNNLKTYIQENNLKLNLDKGVVNHDSILLSCMGHIQTRIDDTKDSMFNDLKKIVNEAIKIEKEHKVHGSLVLPDPKRMQAYFNIHYIQPGVSDDVEVLQKAWNDIIDSEYEGYPE